MKSRGWIWWIVLGLLGVLVAARLFVVELFRVPSASMVPSVGYGAHVAVYKLGHPQRGDVIVFRYPKDPAKDFLKRVIARGGDRVEVRGKQISINGKPVPQRKLDGECSYTDFDESQGIADVRRCVAYEEELDGKTYRVVFDADENRLRDAPLGGREPFLVPPGSFFVMGDNRDNSHDSRYWGAVKSEEVKGTLMSVLGKGKSEVRIGK